LGIWALWHVPDFGLKLIMAIAVGIQLKKDSVFNQLFAKTSSSHPKHEVTLAYPAG
jgi:hypothetical protein